MTLSLKSSQITKRTPPIFNRRNLRDAQKFSNQRNSPKDAEPSQHPFQSNTIQNDRSSHKYNPIKNALMNDLADSVYSNTNDDEFKERIYAPFEASFW